MTAHEPSAVDQVIFDSLVARGEQSGIAWGALELSDETYWALTRSVAAALKAAGFVVATREEIAETWDQGYEAARADLWQWTVSAGCKPRPQGHEGASNPWREVRDV